MFVILLEITGCIINEVKGFLVNSVVLKSLEWCVLNGYQHTITGDIKFFEPHAKKALLTVLGVVMVQIISVIQPFIDAQIIDKLITREEGIPKLILYRLIATLLQNVFHYVQAYYQRMTRLDLERDMRMAAFEAVLKCEIGYFDDNNSGEITSVAIHEVGSASNWLIWHIRCMLDFTVRTIAIIFLSVSFDIRMTISTFLISPLLMTGLTYFNSNSSILCVACRDNWEQMTKIANEAITNIRSVKIFATARYEKKEFKKCLEDWHTIQRFEAWYCESRWAFCNSLPACASSLVMFFGVKLVLRGELTPGQLTAFMTCVGHIMWVFQVLGQQFSTFQRIMVRSHKVFELINRDCELPRTNNLKPDVCHGEVEIKNVNFAYPTKKTLPVLKGLNLKVQPGEVVALVGESGGGKSSIVRLMQYMYGPGKGEGEVLLDGIPVSDYDEEKFAEFMTMVPQEPILFHRSLKENIAYGQPDLTNEQIEEAAKMANAHGFIMKFEKAYDTVVGERGITLSGGQRQRICIARALVRKPNVLLLDEATASLDSKSEKSVHHAIDHLIQHSNGNMSLIIIAHRLSTIKNADKIFVIEDGQVVEVGTHNSLMQKEDGKYASFAKEQNLDETKEKKVLELPKKAISE